MFSVVILAAGQGKRFHSKIPKVFHRICGRAMVSFIVDTARKLEPDRIILVVQDGKTLDIDGVEFAIQREPLGTGDALLSAKSLISEGDDILVLPGDVPLITSSTLVSLIRAHKKNSCTILTTLLSNPASYGRLVRDRGEVEKIVEEKDATDQEREIKEINTGIYIFKTPLVFQCLKELSPCNVQKEYYLTDVVRVIKKKGQSIGTFLAEDNNEVIGINDRSTLSSVAEILNKRIIKRHQLMGVTISLPVAIDYDVKIGKDTTIHPFTALYGRTRIGEGCVIGPNVVITDAIIPPGTVVEPFRNVVSSE